MEFIAKKLIDIKIGNIKGIIIKVIKNAFTTF